MGTVLNKVRSGYTLYGGWGDGGCYLSYVHYVSVKIVRNRNNKSTEKLALVISTPA